MNTEKNKKAIRQQLTATAVSLAVFTLGMILVGLFASHHVKVLAAFMMGAIACLGYAGALFIKVSSAKINESHNKSQWTLLDSRFMS